MKPNQKSSLILSIAAAFSVGGSTTVLAQKPASEDYAAPPAGEILQSLKKDHPRLMITAATKREIQDLIAKDAVAKSVYDRVMVSADKVLEQEPETYRLPDGRRLLSISSSVHGRVSNLAFAYLMTDEKKYLDRAWAELESAANFEDWNPAHFLDTAVMTGAFAIGYDWLWNDWTPEQRKVLEQAIATKGLTPAMKVYGGKKGWPTKENNWNQVCNGGIGLGALAIAGVEPDLAEDVLGNALKGLPVMMATFAPDGGGEEGCGYWNFGSRYNIMFMASMDSSLGTDFGLSRIEGFGRSGDFELYMSGAGRMFYDFSDCGLRKGSAPQHFWMGRKYDTPRYSWFRYGALKDGQGGDVFDLIWFDPRAKDYDISQMPLDRHFREVEKVSMRDSWKDGEGFAAALEGGSNNASHSHIDGGTFILEADGVRWIIDSGKDDQTYQRHTNNAARTDFYRIRAEGHNTLVINPDAGAGQVGDANAVFTSFDSQKERASAELDLSGAYAEHAEKVTRTYKLERGKSFTVTDGILCKEPSSIWSFFHTDAAVTLSADKRTATLKKDGRAFTASLALPSDATFEVLPAEPAEQSPDPAAQTPNTGRCKLAVHLDAVKEASIVVRFSR